jgi:hypothetical protein
MVVWTNPRPVRMGGIDGMYRREEEVRVRLKAAGQPYLVQYCKWTRYTQHRGASHHWTRRIRLAAYLFEDTFT